MSVTESIYPYYFAFSLDTTLIREVKLGCKEFMTIKLIIQGVFNNFKQICTDAK